MYFVHTRSEGSGKTLSGASLMRQEPKYRVLDHINFVIVIPMGCPPERGDNPRALASGLSYVQVDKQYIV